VTIYLQSTPASGFPVATTQSYTVTPYSVPHRWPDPPCRFYAPARRLLHAQYLAAMTIPDAPGSRPAQTIRPRQWSASTTASAPVHRPVADRQSSPGECHPGPTGETVRSPVQHPRRCGHPAASVRPPGRLGQFGPRRRPVSPPNPKRPHRYRKGHRWKELRAGAGFDRGSEIGQKISADPPQVVYLPDLRRLAASVRPKIATVKSGARPFPSMPNTRAEWI